jgi:hypothetical protein
MPNTINGIGTTFYGQCEFKKDRSFITTKWFVLGFFPCIPLASLRVLQLDSKSYAVVTEEPSIHWWQVLRTWAYVLLFIELIAWVAPSSMPPLAKFIIIVAAVFFPHALRAFAKWRT